MNAKILGLALLIVLSGPAAAAEAPVATAEPEAGPSSDDCAGVYGALADDQGNFGVADSLMGERYFNYARIDFQDRLNRLARQLEVGISQLKTDSESARSQAYMKLVDAETEGDLDTATVRQVVAQADSCDSRFGFAPSLGG